MSRKNKKIGKQISNSMSQHRNDNGNGEIFRNVFAVSDDTEPQQALLCLQDIFKGKIDEDVVKMIFTECAYNVDHTLETLMSLSSETVSSSGNSPCDNQQHSLPLEHDHTEIQSTSSTEVNSFRSPDWNTDKKHHTQKVQDIQASNDSTEVDFENTSPDTNNPKLSCQTSTQSLENETTNPPSTHPPAKSNTFLSPCKFSENELQSNHLNPKSSVFVHPETCFSYPHQNSASFIPRCDIFKSTKFVRPQTLQNKCDFQQPSLRQPFFHTAMLNNVRTQRPYKNLSKQYKMNNVVNQHKNKQFSNIEIIIQEIQKGHKVMVILRGLPGSGKTILAQSINQMFLGQVFNTDDYFFVDGKYQFDCTKLSEAHEWNHQETAKAMEKGKTLVIIDNTNTEAWEMVPYVKLGLRLKYKMYILEPDTPWKFKPSELARKNTHKVTKQKIDQMLIRYDHNVTIKSLISSLDHVTEIAVPSSNEQGKISVNANHGSTNTNHGKTYSQQNYYHKEKNIVYFPIKATVDPVTVSGDPNVILLEAHVHQEDVSDAKKYTSNDTQNEDKTTSDPHLKETYNLDDLKMLMNREKEEVKISSHFLPSNEPSHEISSWESITEPDHDFYWSSNPPSEVSEDFKNHCQFPLEKRGMAAFQVSEAFIKKDISRQSQFSNSLSPTPLQNDVTSGGIDDLESFDIYCSGDATETSLSHSADSKRKIPEVEKTNFTSNDDILDKGINQEPHQVQKSPGKSSKLKTPKSCTGAPFVNLLKGTLQNLNETNWVFPTFDSGTSTSHEINFTGLPICFDIGTQTEPSDFIVLYHIEKDSSYVPHFKTLKPSTAFLSNKDTCSLLDKITLKPGCFDKGTSTHDLSESLDDFQTLRMLQSCFPEILEADLQHLLTLCHNDAEWLTNILLEWGYSYNDSSAVSSPFLVQDPGGLVYPVWTSLSNDLQTSSNNTLYIETVPNVDSSECENAKTPNEVMENYAFSTTEESSDQFALIDDGNVLENVMHNRQPVFMTLDSYFASQLERLFGPLFGGEPKTLPEEFRRIDIGQDIAELIYNKWKDGLGNYSSSGCENETICVKPNNKKTPQTKKKVPLLLKSNNEFRQKVDTPMSLAEIMDMEYAFLVHKKEKLKELTGGKSYEESMAIKIKRSHLYSMYPFVDPVALDEIFESNNFSLDHAIMVVENDIGEPPIRLDANAANNMKNDAPDPIEDFTKDGGWSEWVYRDESEEFEDSGPVATDPQELRSEAVFHYQKRQECIRKAQNAYCKSMKDVASFYAQKGDFHATKFKESNKQAAKCILQKRNEILPSTTLDLHGLYIQEAIPALIKYLNKWKKDLSQQADETFKTVCIITGKGAHSSDGPKLKPSVEKYLTKSGYSFSEIYTGMFEVTVLCSSQD